MRPAIGSQWRLYSSQYSQSLDPEPRLVQVVAVETAFVLVERVDGDADEWNCRSRQWISSSLFQAGLCPRSVVSQQQPDRWYRR
jgi:hypothetical protein